MNVYDRISSTPSIPFGVEVEINCLGSKSRLSKNEGTLGIYDIASLVHSTLKDKVNVSGWCNNHGNNYWVVKPDSSCGIEICSPVLKGWYGISRVFDLIVALKQDKRIKVDSRCSFHVHFDVSCFKDEELFSILCWWIKLEGFFMDIVPLSRKVNPYCRLISQSGIVNDLSEAYKLESFVEFLGRSKYYTLNTFHLYNKRRRSIEFRIMDGFCCVMPNSAACWIALLDHFIRCAIKTGPPSPFKGGDPASGLCWLDAKHAFNFLRFDSCGLCRRLKLVRGWLLKRLVFCGQDYAEYGVFSKEMRESSYNEIVELSRFHCR